MTIFIPLIVRTLILIDQMFMKNTSFHSSWPGLLFLLSIGATPLAAQTPTDGILMPGKQVCFGIGFTQDTWYEYWEGALKRDNGNLGTVRRQTVLPMVAYGISNRINVLAALPWVRTHASAGQLAGVSGLQDWGVWLKVEAWRSGNFSLLGVAGATGPASNYLPDYVPLHLGLGAVEGTLRAIARYETPKGLYAWAQAGYHLRSHTTIERTYYYTTQGFYSDKVDMPNALTYGLILGGWVWEQSLRAEIAFDGLHTTGGHDIRRQDMGFPSNRMIFTRIGALAQYFLPPGKQWGLTAGGGYVLGGRNVGQSTVWSAGLLYRFIL